MKAIMFVSITGAVFFSIVGVFFRNFKGGKVMAGISAFLSLVFLSGVIYVRNTAAVMTTDINEHQALNMLCAVMVLTVAVLVVFYLKDEKSFKTFALAGISAIAFVAATSLIKNDNYAEMLKKYENLEGSYVTKNTNSIQRIAFVNSSVKKESAFLFDYWTIRSDACIGSDTQMMTIPYVIEGNKIIFGKGNGTMKFSYELNGKTLGMSSNKSNVIYHSTD